MKQTFLQRTERRWSIAWLIKGQENPGRALQKTTLAKRKDTPSAGILTRLEGRGTVLGS